MPGLMTEQNPVVALAPSAPAAPRRRIVDIGALRRARSDNEPAPQEDTKSSSHDSELERARQEMKAALLPLPPVLQRALLVEVCFALNFQAEEVAGLTASSDTLLQGDAAPSGDTASSEEDTASSEEEDALSEEEDTPPSEEAMPVVLSARKNATQSALAVSSAASRREAEARFRSLLAMVGLVRAREVIDEVEAMLAG